MLRLHYLNCCSRVHRGQSAVRVKLFNPVTYSIQHKRHLNSLISSLWKTYIPVNNSLVEKGKFQSIRPSLFLRTCAYLTGQLFMNLFESTILKGLQESSHENLLLGEKTSGFQVLGSSLHVFLPRSTAVILQMKFLEVTFTLTHAK